MSVIKERKSWDVYFTHTTKQLEYEVKLILPGETYFDIIDLVVYHMIYFCYNKLIE